MRTRFYAAREHRASADRFVPLFFAAIAAPAAWAEHAVIKLQVSGPDGRQESFADQEPPLGGIKRRPRMTVKRGDPLIFEFLLTNAYPHKRSTAVTVRISSSARGLSASKSCPT